MVLTSLTFENASEHLFEARFWRCGRWVERSRSFLLWSKQPEAGLGLDSGTSPAITLMMHRDKYPELEYASVSLTTLLTPGRDDNNPSYGSSPLAAASLFKSPVERWERNFLSRPIDDLEFAHILGPPAMRNDAISKSSQLEIDQDSPPPGRASSSCSTIGWNCMLRKLVRSDRCRRKWYDGAVSILMLGRCKG